MGSGIITSLRTKYLDLVNREADWSARFGKNHNAVVVLRNQIRDMRRSIGDELGRIEEQFKSEYDLAKKREEELASVLTALVSAAVAVTQFREVQTDLEDAFMIVVELELRRRA